MRRISARAWIVSLFLAGCFTVNVAVTFPAAEFQEAADQIVMKIQDEEGTSSARPQALQEGALYASLGPILLAQSTRAAGPPPAKFDLTISNAKTKALLKRLKERFPLVKSLKDAGVAGENLHGYLELRKEGLRDLKLKERAEAKRIVGAENADRKALYLALLKANELFPQYLPQIEAVFAQSWYKAATKKWYVRLTGKEWVTKQAWTKLQEELRRRKHEEPGAAAPPAEKES